jgi:hypothetical protein
MARSRKFLTVGALGVAAIALIAAGAGSTGAYFTDSHPGTINASAGSIKVNVSPADLALNFTGLLPEAFQTQDVTYQAVGSVAEDIWLVLPTDGTAAYLNGTPGNPAPGAPPLGRYGHFAVVGPAGSFTSYNLATDPTTPSTASCGVDTNGFGGSNAQVVDKTTILPYCPVPNAILLSSNANPGDTGVAHITFGYTKLLKGPQASPVGLVANFKIVATQHGILPSDPNN